MAGKRIFDFSFRNGGTNSEETCQSKLQIECKEMPRHKSPTERQKNGCAHRFSPERRYHGDDIYKTMIRSLKKTGVIRKLTKESKRANEGCRPSHSLESGTISVSSGARQKQRYISVLSFEKDRFKLTRYNVGKTACAPND